MAAKVRVTLQLVAERLYSSEQLAELYPESALADTVEIIKATEQANARTDAAQYAQVLVDMGARVALRVEVEEC
jgi:hypothetical protein